MPAILTRIRSKRAQALVELTLIIPMLIALGLGVVEVGNIINSYLVMTHLTREAANLASRQPGTKGSSTWATNINNGLGAAIAAASPVIISTGTAPRGPGQFKVYYSMVQYTTTPCGGGPIASGQTDNYHIVRSNQVGWTGSITWEYGSLGQSSQIGSDGDCAYLDLPEVKNLSTSGIVLHVVEVFYDYEPSKLTPAQNFIGALVPGLFYRRSVFMDVVG
jgi:TadE-like protein